MVETHEACHKYSAGSSALVSLPTPPLFPTLPFSESPPSGGSSSGPTQDCTSRVFKLQSPDLPCDFSSSLPCLTSVELESPPQSTWLIKCGLLFWFDLAYLNLQPSTLELSQPSTSCLRIFNSGVPIFSRGRRNT